MKASAKQPATPKCGTFMGIKGVHLYDTAFTFSQDSDTWQEGDEVGQEIKIFTADSGGGSYIIFSTERWAIDSDDIDKFCDALKRICNTPEEYEE